MKTFHENSPISNLIELASNLPFLRINSVNRILELGPEWYSLNPSKDKLKNF